MGLGEERHLCLPCDPSDSIYIYITVTEIYYYYYYFCINIVQFYGTQAMMDLQPTYLYCDTFQYFIIENNEIQCVH